MILDCENFDTCLASLNKILALPSITILNELSEISPEEIHSGRMIYDSPDLFLLEYFKKNLKASTEFTSSFWFHNSRVRKGTDFNEGILPLNLMIVGIQTFIDTLAKSIEPAKISSSVRDNSSGGYHFMTKVMDKAHWGPYANLVRQIAVQSPIGFHNYLRIPEIVEDYIECKYQSIREELEQKYFDNTISCIVKFQSNRKEVDLLGKALYYLYLTLRGEELDIDSNTCYDGNAERIDANRICKIEYYQSCSKK